MMPTDFDRLVLRPAMHAFGKPITITPTVSQPNAAPYPARGVWEEQHVEIPLMDGGLLSANTLDLGIRLSEFAVRPVQGDFVGIADTRFWRPELIGSYVINDVKPDGQGGAKIILKRQQ
jgi:hypothetical protein